MNLTAQIYAVIPLLWPQELLEETGIDVRVVKSMYCERRLLRQI